METRHTSRKAINIDTAPFLEAKELLQRELTRRIQANSRYSMRSFAKALKMSPATLSQILSGKQDLTLKRLETIALVLGLTPQQQDFLKHTIQRAKRKALPTFPNNRGRGHLIKLDVFTVLSDWYHFAILSLLEIEKSSIDPKWISAKLGISIHQAKFAVERLKRLELIKEVDGRWKQSTAPLSVEREVATGAARNFQRQLIQKALYALDNEPSERRDITSITFCADPADFEFASEKITEFRRWLSSELEQRGKPKEVYNLTIQLYPVTHEK